MNQDQNQRQLQSQGYVIISGEAPQVEINGRVNHVRVSADGPVLEVQGTGSVPFYNIVEFGRSA